MATFQQVKAKHPNWFSRENKRFFGDVSYKVLHGKASKAPYLVRSTYAWSDMFGQPAKLHWRVNPLLSDLDIGQLIDQSFDTLEDVREWLEDN